MPYFSFSQCIFRFFMGIFKNSFHKIFIYLVKWKNIIGKFEPYDDHVNMIFNPQTVYWTDNVFIELQNCLLDSDVINQIATYIRTWLEMKNHNQNGVCARGCWKWKQNTYISVSNKTSYDTVCKVYQRLWYYNTCYCGLNYVRLHILVLQSFALQ